MHKNGVIWLQYLSAINAMLILLLQSYSLRANHNYQNYTRRLHYAIPISLNKYFSLICRLIQQPEYWHSRTILSWQCTIRNVFAICICTLCKSHETLMKGKKKLYLKRYVSSYEHPQFNYYRISYVVSDDFCPSDDFFCLRDLLYDYGKLRSTMYKILKKIS